MQQDLLPVLAVLLPVLAVGGYLGDHRKVGGVQYRAGGVVRGVDQDQPGAG